MNISFLNLCFDLFSIIAKEVNQIRNKVVCVVARLVFVLQCVSTYFRKLKEIGVLWTIFPGYVISCDYGLLFIDSENLCFTLILREKMARFLTFNIVHLSRLTSFVFYQKQNVRAFIIILGVTMKGVPFES